VFIITQDDSDSVATDRVKEVLVDSGERGCTALELAEELGLEEKAKAGWNVVYRARQKYDEWDEHITKQRIDGETRYVWKGMEKDKLYESVKNLSEEIKKGKKPKREGTDVLLETGKDKILLVFGSDFHLGSQFVDYDGVEKVMEDIGQHDNVYFVGLGDMIDNSVISHSPKGTHNLVDKNEQLDLLEHLFNLAGMDSILRLYEGNHELRSFMTDRFLPMKWEAIQQESDYGAYMNPFIVSMPDREWKFFCRHKPKYSSQYNPIHGCVRAPMYYMGRLAKDADIIVMAHTHRMGLGQWETAGKWRYMLSCGSQVEFSHYAERTGFASGKDTVPAVLLRTDRKPQMFKDYKNAIREHWEEVTYPLSF